MPSTATPDLYTLRGQADALLRIIVHFPELPAPYVAMLAGSPMTLQLSSPADFELWREALEIDADGVTLHGNPRGSWLSAEGIVRTRGRWEIPVHLTGHNIAPAAVQPAEHLAAVA